MMVVWEEGGGKNRTTRKTHINRILRFDFCIRIYFIPNCVTFKLYSISSMLLCMASAVRYYK